MASHTPSDDHSFWISVGRHLGGAVALVLTVTAAFWGIGQLRSDDAPPDDVAVIDSPSPAAPDDSPDDSPAAPTVEPAPPSPGGSPAASPEAPPPSPEPPPSEQPGAGDISVQILDAVLDDDGGRATAAAVRLREAGYPVVAENAAIRVYEQTTVFYTEGNQAAAEQVRETLGVGQVEPKPDNLSDTVAVHLVVGRDYPA